MAKFYEWWYQQAAGVTAKGSRFVLSGYTISNKGADWVMMASDLNESIEEGRVSLASLFGVVRLLPLARNSRVRIVTRTGKEVLNLSNKEARYLARTPGKIKLADMLRKGAPFTEQEIMKAFRSSKHTAAAKEVLQALESGKIKLHLDRKLANAGETVSATKIVLRPDMRMQDTLGVLVQEGQHALDIEKRIVPIPSKASSFDQLHAEARAWSAQLEYLKRNKFTNATAYDLLYLHPENLLFSLGESYLGKKAYAELSDESVRSILAAMTDYGQID